MMQEESKNPWEEEEKLRDSQRVREEEENASAPVPIPYNLEGRTAKFGEAAIDFCASIRLGPRTNRLVDQLTGCGTSIGANYCEADNSLSRKDFINIIGICRKEACESQFFFRMMARASPACQAEARRL